MADSKKPVVLLLKCATFVCIVTLSYVGLLYLTFDSDQDSYLAANLDKMRLMSETRSPKMLFIGGSNLAFGLDSAKIRQAFSMPVVNTGVHAALGLKFMLDQVTPHLKRGDIVVVVPEYSFSVGNSFYGGFELLELVTRHTHEWRVLRSMYIPAIPSILLRANVRLFDYKPMRFRNATDVYRRNSFNSDGDVTVHLKLPNRKFSAEVLLKTDVNQTAMQYLYDFVSTNVDRGITSVVVYPCLERSYYRHNVATIAMITKALSGKGIHVASTPQDFVYDDDLFFDTTYHLNARGRQLRTEKMIQVLAKALPKMLKQH